MFFPPGLRISHLTKNYELGELMHVLLINYFFIFRNHTEKHGTVLISNEVNALFVLKMTGLNIFKLIYCVKTNL